MATLSRDDELEALLGELKRRKRERDGLQYVPHEMHPKQRDFLSRPELEVLAAGGTGSGKSDALLAAALQYATLPQYSALIVRRTFSELALPGALMDRSHQWLHNTDAHWDGQMKTWKFPSGARLQFGYIESEKDKWRYQGSELHFAGVDEITAFPEQTALFLLSRLRKNGTDPIPLRYRATCNPDGIHMAWVYHRYIESRSPDRFSLQMNLQDNPSVDQASYRKSLEKLDEVSRRRLLDGEWIMSMGGLVYNITKQNLLEEPPDCDYFILGMDYGYVDACAFVVLGWSKFNTTVYVISVDKFEKMTPSDAADHVRHLETKYPFSKMVADIGGLGKGYAEEAKIRYRLPIEPADKVNKIGYTRMLAGDVEKGLLKFVGPACKSLLEEIRVLPWTEDRQSIAEGYQDHAVDAMLYGWRAAVAFLEPPPVREPPKFSEEWNAREEERLIERVVQRVRGDGRDSADPYNPSFERAEDHFSGRRRGWTR